MWEELLIKVILFTISVLSFGILYLAYRWSKTKQTSSRLAKIVYSIIGTILDRNHDGKVDVKDVPKFIDDEFDRLSDMTFRKEEKDDQRSDHMDS